MAWAFSVMTAVLDRPIPLLCSGIFGLLFLFLARLPLEKVLRRLLVVNGLIFLLWLFLPFTMPGRAAFSLGALEVTKEGIFYAATITIKSNVIIVTLISLIATMPVFTMGKAMGRMRVPQKMVFLLSFTYRYIHVIHREYRRLMNTLKIRGFVPKTNLHTYRTYAYLIGIVLIKSYDRSRRVQAAMLCRGFKGQFFDMSEFTLKGGDWAFLAVISGAVISMGICQWTRIVH
jgi:cobalt/nickel transport system permease protein